MQTDEIDTLIQLRYFPVQYTVRYLSSLPEEVLKGLDRRAFTWAGMPPTEMQRRARFTVFWATERNRPQMETILREELRTFYLANPETK